MKKDTGIPDQIPMTLIPVFKGPENELRLWPKKLLKELKLLLSPKNRTPLPGTSKSRDFIMYRLTTPEDWWVIIEEYR